MSKKVFIIIVTYNGMPWLQQCLDSCKGQNVVVVDNNSTDETVAFIKKNFPGVVLFPQIKNLGFGQANNLGIRYALEQGADYVFLLNQDAYLQDGCIEKLVAIHKNNDNYGILSPIHFNGKGSELDENFLMYLNRYKISNTILFNTFKSNQSDVYSIEFVNAAGWLISLKCLEKVGGFDPLFFHYGEDRNYCQRVIFHGFKIGIVTSARIHHDRENRTKSDIKKYSIKFYEEFERYLKVNWADINLANFEERYNKKCQVLLKKHRRLLLKLDFEKANEFKTKGKIMLQQKTQILKSRKANIEGKGPYI